jgi:hypothetical protein
LMDVEPFYSSVLHICSKHVPPIACWRGGSNRSCKGREPGSTLERNEKRYCHNNKATCGMLGYNLLASSTGTQIDPCRRSAGAADRSGVRPEAWGVLGNKCPMGHAASVAIHSVWRDRHCKVVDGPACADHDTERAGPRHCKVVGGPPARTMTQNGRVLGIAKSWVVRLRGP